MAHALLRNATWFSHNRTTALIVGRSPGRSPWTAGRRLFGLSRPSRNVIPRAEGGSWRTRGRGRDSGYPLPPAQTVLALLTHTVPTLDDDVADHTRRPVPLVV